MVCGGIHLSDIPSFYYNLFGKKELYGRLQALTREDAKLFLLLAFQIPVKTEVVEYPLYKANEAIESLREGKYIKLQY